MIGITIFSALFCAISRAALSIFDRKFFQNIEVDFLKGIFLNAIYPFLFACLNCLLVRGFDEKLWSLLFNPGVILSGLGAQLAAYAASQSLRNLHVRKVAWSSKTSDILIPLALFALNGKFCLQEYMFVSLTTLSFAPIAKAIAKEGQLYAKISYVFIGSLVFQALINSYFHISDYAATWTEFSQLMVGVLLWRALFMFPSLAVRLCTQKENGFKPLTREIMQVLCLRGGLAFLSQGAFFFSITRENSFIAWPILNATPILGCYLAHFFLQEKVGRSELQTVFCFFLVFCFYFIVKGVFL